MALLFTSAMHQTPTYCKLRLTPKNQQTVPSTKRSPANSCELNMCV